MTWLVNTLALLFEVGNITPADDCSELLPLFQFRVVNLTQIKSGNYKNLKGTIEVNYGNEEGIEQTFTTEQRNKLHSIIPGTEEKIDLKTGIVNLSFDIIINNNIE